MLSSELASWQNGELGSKRVVVEAKLFQWIVMLLRLPGEGNLLLQLVHLRFLQMIRPKGIWLCHRQRLVPPGLCEVGRSCLHTVTEWLCLGRLGYLTDELDLNRLGVTWKLKRLLRTGDDVSETCRTANLQYALVSAMSLAEGNDVLSAYGGLSTKAKRKVLHPPEHVLEVHVADSHSRVTPSHRVSVPIGGGYGREAMAKDLKVGDLVMTSHELQQQPISQIVSTEFCESCSVFAITFAPAVPIFGANAADSEADPAQWHEQAYCERCVEHPRH